MYKGNYIVSIIPARGGSKGVPRKNLKNLLGKPLIAYSIEQSSLSRYIDQTIVSTEDTEISEVSKKYGAKVMMRPKQLADDTTPTEPVLINVLEQLSKEGVNPDFVVLLQPTSPIRRKNDIDNSIKMLIDNCGDSLLSVRENTSFFWSRDGEPLNYNYKSRPRRQDKQWELVENGSIYITRKEILLKSQNRLGGHILTYIMPEWASYEIDTLFDFDIVKYIAEKKFPLNNNVDKIKLVFFDVDGVFTDGSVYVDSNGRETLKFSRIDGKGIELLIQAGINIAVVTSEETEIVKKRMEKLGITHVFTGIQNKETIYEFLKKELAICDDEIACCGDDIGDLSVLKKAGFAACPHNAVDDIKHECHHVSSFCGGSGFVREICEMLIKSKKAGYL